MERDNFSPMMIRKFFLPNKYHGPSENKPPLDFSEEVGLEINNTKYKQEIRENWTQQFNSQMTLRMWT